MKILVVDDEPLARSRLRALLAECSHGAAALQTEEAQDASDALNKLQKAIAQGCAFDLILLDIHMPGQSGMRLAQMLHKSDHAPAIIFVTAYAEHAVDAFGVQAVDYLTKPVRLERLRQALEKVPAKPSHAQDASSSFLLIQDRLRTLRIPLDEVVYFKAELKYITVRTVQNAYVLDGSLNELEQRLGSQFLRIHRNALVRVKALHALKKQLGSDDADAWHACLHGVEETLPVSRRQLNHVRDALAGNEALS